MLQDRFCVISRNMIAVFDDNAHFLEIFIEKKAEIC